MTQAILDARLLASKLDDLLDKVEQKGKPSYLGFFDMRQQVLVRDFFKRNHWTNFRFDGGHPDPERVFCTVWARGRAEPLAGETPITGLSFSFRSEENPNHQDFMGALLHLQIEKDKIGDLLIGEGQAVLFLSDPIARVVDQELKKVGRTGLTRQGSFPNPLPPLHRFVPIKLAVSSPRLDAIVAALAKISRGKAEEMVESGLVSLNFFPCLQGTKHLDEGDILSIRGLGRFRLCLFSGETRKGRQNVLAEKYI